MFLKVCTFILSRCVLKICLKLLSSPYITRINIFSLLRTPFLHSLLSIMTSYWYKSLFPHPEELKKLLHSSNVNHISWATDLYNSALRYVGQEPTYSHHHLLYQFTNFDDLTDKICLLLHSKTDIEWDVSCTNRNFLKLIKYIQENFTTDISSQTLAEELSLNACYIGQLLKKETGTTLPQYLNELRINYAKELLITTEMGINEIGETCGYQDYFYFIKKFKKNTGKTPSAFRQESKI